MKRSIYTWLLRVLKESWMYVDLIQSVVEITEDEEQGTIHEAELQEVYSGS